MSWLWIVVVGFFVLAGLFQIWPPPRWESEPTRGRKPKRDPLVIDLYDTEQLQFLNANTYEDLLHHKLEQHGIQVKTPCFGGTLRDVFERARVAVKAKSVSWTRDPAESRITVVFAYDE